MIRTGLLLLLLLSTATPLAAHTRLERSSPAAGDTLRTPPYELRLVFSQAVAPRYTAENPKVIKLSEQVDALRALAAHRPVHAA